MKSVIKWIYSIIPFKKQLFSILKMFYVPKEGTFEHLHFKGQFTVKVDRSKRFEIQHHGYMIENQIFWKGLSNGWEKHSMNIWERLCAESDVIFDIGANTGVYALVAKTIRPTAQVFAFEPVARVFKKLKYNVSLNNYDIACEEKAVSDKTGTAVIYDTNSEHTLSVTVNKNLSVVPDETFKVNIQTITLDDYIRSAQIKKIDLIKLDVEMHEVEALTGYKEFIHLHQPSFLIEILNDEVAKGIEGVIMGIDYRYFNIDENNGVTEVKTLGKSAYYNFLICKEPNASLVRALYDLPEPAIQ